MKVPGRRIMIRKTAGPCIELLTACQVNIAKVPDRRTMREGQLGLAVNHSQAVKSIQSECQVEQL